MNSLSNRQLYFSGSFVCLVMILYALYAEHYLFLAPCPLCVLQRIAVVVTGILFLIAAIHLPETPINYIYNTLILITSLAGTGIAGWHTWLQNLPADKVPSCGPGFDYLVGNFPLGDALLLIFSGSGECATTDWNFMWLSMPAWVAISCLLLASLSIFISYNSFNK